MLAKTTAILALKSPGEAGDTEAVSVYQYIKCTRVSTAHYNNREYQDQDSSEVYNEISRPATLPNVVTCRSACGETVCVQPHHVYI